MTEDVAAAVRDCEACARIKATFSHEHATLQPLPIEGLGYRWGVDMTGPMPTTTRGNKYVMVCIEHFSKYVELVALPNKLAATTARAFMDNVISRWGAPAEVVTDQGTEFCKEFDELLQQCMIDHRRTAPNHPQADGASERMVQVVKAALRKYELLGKRGEWDQMLAWVGLGYRCSTHASTKFTPYFLAFGRHPVIPPAVRERFAEDIDFDDEMLAAKMVTDRAETLQQACVTASGNLAIAQHRDTLRYAVVRGGSYLPKIRRFSVGDFVFIKSPDVKKTTLDSPTKPLILSERSAAQRSYDIAGEVWAHYEH